MIKKMNLRGEMGEREIEREVFCFRNGGESLKMV